MTSKMGRPTTDPKPYRIGVRIGEETKAILDKYCEQKQVTQTEAVRDGIEKLKPDLEK